MVTMSPGLIIFDCDGTLVDTENACATSLAALLETYGVRLDVATVLRDFTGLSNDDTVAHVLHQYGVALPQEFLVQMDESEVAAVAQGTQPMPGVTAQWIESLSGQTCVASNGSMRKMRASLGCSGLLKCFEPNLFSSEQVERGKPAPDLFLFAANALNFKPTQCLVVEDSAAGIQAAVASEMPVLGLVGHLSEEKIRELGAVPIQTMACISAMLSS